MRLPSQQSAQSTQADTPAIQPVNGMDANGWEYSLPRGTASLLDNWFIGRNNEVMMRKGWAQVGTCISSIASTLMPFELNGHSVLLCHSQGRITNALTDQILLTTATGSSKMSYTHISNHLVTVAAGNTYSFDGTTFQATTWTGGPTASNLIGVVAHNERCFFWAADSADFWYGPVGAIQGPMIQFPLSNLGSISGNIVNMASWTVDAGHGSNDVLVIMTSKGEVVAYEGLDPGDATDWRLTGRFKVPDIVPSRRAAFKVGADLMIQTKSGVISLTDVFRASEMSSVRNVTEAVDPLYADEAFYDNFGIWVGLLDPQGRMVIFNHENTDGQIYQYVKCLESGVWTRFSGLAAVDWASFNGKMYFVTKGGTIAEFWTGDTDAGNQITGVAMMGGFTQEREVSVSMVQTILNCEQDVPVTVTVINANNSRTSEANATLAAGVKSVNTMSIDGRGDSLLLHFVMQNGGGTVKWRKSVVRLKQSNRRV